MNKNAVRSALLIIGLFFMLAVYIRLSCENGTNPTSICGNAASVIFEPHKSAWSQFWDLWHWGW